MELILPIYVLIITYIANICIPAVYIYLEMQSTLQQQNIEESTCTMYMVTGVCELFVNFFLLDVFQIVRL